jgi:hypothetical protein
MRSRSLGRKENMNKKSCDCIQIQKQTCRENQRKVGKEAEVVRVKYLSK